MLHTTIPMATNPLQKLQMDMQPINRSIPKMHPSTNRTRTQPTTHPNPTTHTTPKLVTDMATPTATMQSVTTSAEKLVSRRFRRKQLGKSSFTPIFESSDTCTVAAEGDVYEACC
jgi:hypothetical protein